MLYNEYAIKLMTEQGFNPAHMYCIANSMDSDKEKELRTSFKTKYAFTKNTFTTTIPQSSIVVAFRSGKIRHDY